jgi:hypothetical protein
MGFRLPDVQIPVLTPLMERATSAILATARGPEGTDWASRYATELAAREAQKRAYSEEHPYLAGAGQVAGAAITAPLVPSLSAARVAGYVPEVLRRGLPAVVQSLPSVISRPIQAVGRGLAPVGLTAAETSAWGAAEEAAKFRPGESLGDVASRAAEEAETAGIVGGGLRAGLGALGAGYRTVRNFVNPQRDIAERATTQALGKGQLTMDEYNRAMELGLPVSIADLPGGRPMVERALGRIGQKEAPRAQELQEFFQGRQAEASTTTRNMIDNIFKREIDPSLLRREAEEAARAVNAPAYRAAYSQPIAQHVWNDELARFLEHPEGQKAAQKAIDALTLRSQTPGGFTNPFIRENGQIVFSGQGNVPLEFWDRFRRSLRDEAEELYRRGRSADGGDLTNFKDQLQGYLTTNFVPYRQAVEGAGKYLRAEDAFTAGQNFFKMANIGRNSPDLQLVGQQLYQFNNKFLEPEKEAFRTGLASYIRENPNDAAKVFANRDAEVMRRYRQVLGDDIFKDIQTTMLAHNAAQNIRGIAATSGTVQQGIERVGQYGGIGSLIAAATFSGSPITWAHTLAAMGVSGAGALSNFLNNARARQILNLAISDKPEDAKRLVELARRQPGTGKILEELSSLTGRVFANIHEQPITPQRQAGGRVGRASGGRLMRNDHSARAATLIRAAEAAKKAHNATTEGILEQPDEAVAKALSIANKAI